MNHFGYGVSVDSASIHIVNTDPVEIFLESELYTSKEFQLVKTQQVQKQNVEIFIEITDFFFYNFKYIDTVLDSL